MIFDKHAYLGLVDLLLHVEGVDILASHAGVCKVQGLGHCQIPDVVVSLGGGKRQGSVPQASVHAGFSKRARTMPVQDEMSCWLSLACYRVIMPYLLHKCSHTLHCELILVVAIE